MPSRRRDCHTIPTINEIFRTPTFITNYAKISYISFFTIISAIILQSQYYFQSSFYFLYPTLCDFPFFSPHFVTLPIQLLAIRYNVFYIFAIITDKPNHIIRPKQSATKNLP